MKKHLLSLKPRLVLPSEMVEFGCSLQVFYFHVVMFIPQSFSAPLTLIMITIKSFLRQKFEMDVWLTISSKFQGSELQRVLPQSFVAAQRQNFLFCMSKIREWVKPLDKQHKDFDAFFNKINTLFGSASGLTVKLLATYFTWSTKSQDKEFW